MLGGVGLVISIGLVWYWMAGSALRVGESLPNRLPIPVAPTVPTTDATTRAVDIERPDELSRHPITLVPGEVNVLTP